MRDAEELLKEKNHLCYWGEAAKGGEQKPNFFYRKISNKMPFAINTFKTHLYS